MCPRVCPGVIDDGGACRAERHRIAGADGLVQPRQAVRIGRSPHDTRAGARPHGIRSCHMVVVMVRQEDGIEAAAARVHRAHRSGLIRRIDDADRPARFVAQQPRVIVRKHRHRLDSDGHTYHLSFVEAAPIDNVLARSISRFMRSIDVRTVGAAWMMSTLDVGSHTARGFYESRLGQMAAAIVCRRCSCSGRTSRASPCSAWAILARSSPSGRRKRAAASTPPTSHQRAAPAGACAVDAVRLPFPDLVFDRILVIHGVEPVVQDSQPAARDLACAEGRRPHHGGGAEPHRPVGACGQHALRPGPALQVPASSTAVLASAMFRPERRDRALCSPPPTSLGPVLQLTRIWEVVGQTMFADLAGVTLTEAVKDTYAALPVGAPRQTPRGPLRSGLTNGGVRPRAPAGSGDSVPGLACLDYQPTLR